MARILLIGFLIVLAFAGSVVGLMAMNQQLNMASIGQLLGRAPEEESHDPKDPVGPLAERLR